MFEAVSARHDGEVVISLRGELDVATEPAFRAELDAVVAAPCRVVVDMSDLEFMDSSGLSTLVRARQQLLGEGGELVVRHPSGIVRRVLEVSGLTVLVEDPDA